MCFVKPISSIIVCILYLPIFIHAVEPSCKPGTFRKGTKCITCPSGTYSSAVDALSCKPCPPGFYNPFPAAQGPDLCRPCPANTFNHKSGASSESACKPCPPNKTNNGAASTCISCPAGNFVSSCYDSERCTEVIFVNDKPVCRCNFDNDDTSPRKLQCLPCPQDEISTKANSFKCEACPLDLFAPPGSTSCGTCRAGTGSDPFSAESKCKPCRGRLFNDGTTARCKQCPPGFTGDMLIGATKCLPCPSGTFRRDERSSKCRECGAGENSSITGATYCMTDNTPCASNFFRNARGACEQCDKLHRYDRNSKSCKPCGSNQLSKGGIDRKCTNCPRNMFVMYEGCQCLPGYTRTLDGECVPCPPGTFRPTDGSVECEPCPRGFHQPKPGQSKCERCPPGKSQPLKGQKICQLCQKGFVPQLPTPVDCVLSSSNCKPGKDRVVDKNGVFFRCNPLECPEGQFLKQYAENKYCRECEEYERYDPKSNDCVRCKGGKQSDGGVSTKCFSCPGDSYYSKGKCLCNKGRELHKGVCRYCPAGTNARYLQSGCDPCEPGRFSRTEVTFGACGKTCPAGTVSGFGAKKCDPCPPGTVTFGVGEASCVVPGSRQNLV